MEPGPAVRSRAGTGLVYEFWHLHWVVLNLELHISASGMVIVVLGAVQAWKCASCLQKSVAQDMNQYHKIQIRG